MDQDNPQLNKMADEMLKATETYFYTFTSDTGTKVLTHLESVLNGSLLSPTTACDFQAEITPEQLMFMREGQQQVLRYMKSMMKYYKDNK